MTLRITHLYRSMFRFKIQIVSLTLLMAALSGCAKKEEPEDEPRAPDAALERVRGLNPDDVQVPAGYVLEVFASGLSFPTDITFDAAGNAYVSEAGGHSYGMDPAAAPPARILRIGPGGAQQVVYDGLVDLPDIREAASTADMPEGLIAPVTGVTYHEERLYVAHRGRVSVVDPDGGGFRTIINGIPSWGEFHNYKVIFGPNAKMYFFVSTQGNAGTIDEHWLELIRVFDKLDAHDSPCEEVVLTGENFKMPDLRTESEGDSVMTGIYVPLGTETRAGQRIAPGAWCHGAMYQANPDGSDIRPIAWGLRSNYGYRFSSDGRLVTTQNSGNPLEPRPIYDGWEPVYEVVEGEWYGWPDFFSSIPVTDARFSRPNDPDFKKDPVQHRFALTPDTHERLLGGRDRPRDPLARLPVHSSAEGFVFGRSAFGVSEEEILVAEFGTIVAYLHDDMPGFKVQRVNLSTGAVSDFLVNRSGKPASSDAGGGLERPIQLEWGPDGALYIVDFGVILFDGGEMRASPNTGVIWKLTRTSEASSPEPVQQPRAR